ncbi:MAG: ornithine cyclodeaminase family protein [Dehalococcoidia bacterium]|nr:ornithine cyclodeaminase family protein [Dehalococcoidia bacterium]
MAIFLTEQDINELMTVNDVLPVIEEGFREQGLGLAVNRSRARLKTTNGSMSIMTASIPGLKVAGFKATGTGGRVMVYLYSGETGRLEAIIEAGRMGQLRTGAASGIATKYLARADSSIVGMYGTGTQARTQIQAVCAVMPVKKVLAYSRDPERRAEFCRRMSESLGVEFVPAGVPEDAAKDADIIITITNTREPVLNGEWVKPGTHINAAGGNSLTRRELDTEAVRKADVIVADSIDQAKIESADLVMAVEQGIINWEQVGELGKVVAGKDRGRENDRQITLFESHGIAIWDVAAGAKALELARAKGVGTPLPF